MGDGRSNPKVHTSELKKYREDRGKRSGGNTNQTGALLNWYIECIVVGNREVLGGRVTTTILTPLISEYVKNDRQPFTIPSNLSSEPSSEPISAQLTTGDRQPRRMARAEAAGDHEARPPLE